MTKEEREAAISYLEIYRKIDEELFKMSPQNSVAHHAAAQCLKYWDMAIEALKQEPITKNDLAVDCISREQAIEWVDNLRKMDECFGNHKGDYYPLSEVIDRLQNVPSVTPQEPKTGYISIDDAMSVFDDFMCGEVDEEGTETFLEMLKDKAESEAEDGNDES